MRHAALIALASLILGACGLFGKDDEPPRLLRYEIAEGTPSCDGCALNGPRVAPGTDGVLVLRLETTYTARSYVRTAGNSDHCIPVVFGYSWWLPVHDFLCTPESEEMVIDDRIPTQASMVHRDTSPTVKVALWEYETSSRRVISKQELYQFQVRFVP